MSKPAIYHRLEPGKYVCCTCGTIHDGPCARQDATTCCRHLRSNKSIPGHNAQSEAHMEILYTRYLDRQTLADASNRRFLKNPDGYTDPTPNGSWRRPRDPVKRRSVQVHRAWHNLEIDLEKQSPRSPSHYGSRSPLQALAYAFQTHNWENVKAAAYALAREEVLLSEVRFRHRLLSMFDQALDGIALDDVLSELDILEANTSDIPESEL